MNHGGGMHTSRTVSWSSGSSVTDNDCAVFEQQLQTQQYATPTWPSFQNEPLFDDEVKIGNVERDKQQLDEAKAARKRQYHKEVVARSRLRRKMSAAAIQQQEVVLGRKLHDLLQQTGHPVTQKPESAVVPCEDGPLREQELLHRYAEQVATQERILLENKELHRRIEDHAKLYDAIEKECALSDIATDYGDCAKGSRAYRSAPRRRPAERALFQRMLNLYSEFMERRVPISELEFFGWRVMRPLEVVPNILRFQFIKTVRVVDDSMDAIVNRTWDAFHDPKKFASIYSTPVTTRVIQRVTNDMTVLIQNAPVQSGEQRNIRYFNILARARGLNAQNERVVALLKTIMSPTDCQSAGEITTQLHEIEWMKRGISYLLLTQEATKTETRTIRLHYGCDYECTEGGHVSRRAGDSEPNALRHTRYYYYGRLWPPHLMSVRPTTAPLRIGHGARPLASESHWLLSTAGKWTEEDEKEWKRQQHRENMVFFRRKKKEQQAELRNLHQQLEQRLQQHLAMQRRAASRATRIHHRPSRTEQKHAAVVHLIAETEALKIENTALRERIDGHKTLRESVVEAGDGLESNATEPTSSVSSRDGSNSDSSLSGSSLSSGSSSLSHLISLQRGWRVHLSGGELSFHFHPFSKEQLDAVRQGYDAKFAESPPMESVGSMFGWDVERAPLVPHPSLNVLISRVRYTRRIHCAGGSARDTMDKLDVESWPVLTTPELWQRIHGGVVTSQVLQAVDEDTRMAVCQLRVGGRDF
ncbi:hypothetical protein GQ600_8979 [Phytophthora cactorum]|nr:hypothetical protein GQ600_8979 [Phytophthora cactorum]